MRKEHGRRSPGRQAESVLRFILVIRISDAAVMGTERREILVKWAKKKGSPFRKKMRIMKYIVRSSEN